MATLSGPTQRPYLRTNRSLLLCAADDRAWGRYLLFCATFGGLRAGPARRAIAQRPGYRYGADHPLSDAVRHATPVSGGPRRPPGGPRTHGRLCPPPSGAALTLFRDA